MPVLGLLAAPNLVTTADLGDLQRNVRKIAAEAGWPIPMTRLGGPHFDRHLAAELHRQTRILPRGRGG